jgi:hypothetical protein
MIRRPLALAIVMAGFFVLFTRELTGTSTPSWILLFGAIAVFRLMASFEKGR